MKKILLALLLIAGTSLLKASENEQQEIEKQEFIKKYIKNPNNLPIEKALFEYFVPRKADHKIAICLNPDICKNENCLKTKNNPSKINLSLSVFNFNSIKALKRHLNNFKQKCVLKNNHFDYVIYNSNNDDQNTIFQFNIKGEELFDLIDKNLNFYENENPISLVLHKRSNTDNQNNINYQRPYNLFSFTNLLTVGAISLIGWFTYSYFAK